MTCSCWSIHEIAGTLVRHRFPFCSERIPDNGIYLLFEFGESAHGVDRIVRVGTHTGEGRLRQRIEEHFNIPNKDRSIFSKNIGRAILHSERDPFLEQWNRDLTTIKERERHGPHIDFTRQKAIEEEVTDLIQTTFSFVVLPVEDKDDRLKVESGVIATISLCEDCGPSDQWLGKYSPKSKIKTSGLWQEKHLYKTENRLNLVGLWPECSVFRSED